MKCCWEQDPELQPRFSEMVENTEEVLLHFKRIKLKACGQWRKTIGLHYFRWTEGRIKFLYAWSYSCNHSHQFCAVSSASLIHSLLLRSDIMSRVQPFIQALDVGDHFCVFNSVNNIEAFGFGDFGCATFDPRCVSGAELMIVCLLPRDICGWVNLKLTENNETSINHQIVYALHSVVLLCSYPTIFIVFWVQLCYYYTWWVHIVSLYK